MDVWSAKESAYVEALREKQQSEVKKKKQNKTSTKKRENRTSASLDGSVRSLEEYNEVWKLEKAAEEQLEEMFLKDAQPVFEVDESKVPFSAWPLHANARSRVRAATHYMQAFQAFATSLKQEPMLSQAMLQALTLVAEGGEVNTFIGTECLKARETQKQLKGETCGRGKELMTIDTKDQCDGIEPYSSSPDYFSSDTA